MTENETDNDANLVSVCSQGPAPERKALSTIQRSTGINHT